MANSLMKAFVILLGLHIKGNSFSFDHYAFKSSLTNKRPNSQFLQILFKLSTMVATQNTSTNEVLSQPIMKIQSTNYHVEGNVSLYPEELKMLIIALQNSGLATIMFNSFAVLITWLSMAASAASYSMATYVITFNLINEKWGFV